MARYKVVRSSNPMIQKNYVGKTGTVISRSLSRDGKHKMVVLQFKRGVQAFYKSEVQLVRKKPKKKRKK